MFGVVQERKKSVKKRKSPRKQFLSFRWKKILPWIFVFLLIVLLVFYYLYKNYYSNYNYIKKDSSQYLVYTKSSSTNNQNMKNEIPEINIDSKDADLVNKAIQNYAEDFLKNKNNLFVYDSQVNGEVLSVLLKMLNYEDGYSFPTVSFHTYNFNLKNQTLMEEEEVLDLFGVSDDDVSKKIKGQLQSYYNDEVSKGYLLRQECDYDCFLKWRGIDDYMDSVYYYIDHGNLIAYRAFSIYSVYGEEEYFTDESYEFYIAG